MDLFSELPQGVIHRILKFLPTKATTQTSVLSKSWKSAWDSRPIVDLDLKMLKPYEEKIPEFTMKALERYVHQGLGIEQLNISWNTSFTQDMEYKILDSMSLWLDFALAADAVLRIVLKTSSFRASKIYS
ncbi:F-box/LRR-repeat protein At1g55660-like [Morus notabilis]|uniref:F-box/LRR-repeat protein At1g55660-like n=1 Tax=Morus notabilis TaxID=981085 RepID=UPI000CED2DAB|nr:F-box/LRR-repeat protein At1g55660-like [Morus notabilis]